MNLSRSRLNLAIASWVVAVIGVWLWTTGYGFSTYPASDNFPRDSWPHSSSLALADNRPTLLLFMHPRCPCTQASVKELERMLTGQGLCSKQQPDVIVVASVPTNASEQWRDTDTIERAAKLPNATVIWDIHGVESTRFGAVVSGTVMLYVPSGARFFAGGITASRGHEGGNAGCDRLKALLAENIHCPQESTPIFGCKLCVADCKSASSMSCDLASDGEEACCHDKSR